MWQLCTTLFAVWFQYCTAYDIVIFSTLNLKKMAVEDLAASSKILAIGVKDFSLPNFGLYAQAYSGENSDSPFSSLMRIFPYQKALSMVTSNDGDIHRSSTGVDYTQKDLHDFLTSDRNFEGYETVIISSQDAFENELVRRKRVSSNVSFDDEPSSHAVSEMDNRQRLSASDRHDMPVVLPPPNPSQKTACLLYMEAFDIIISNSRFLTVGSEGKNKYSSGPDHCKCNVNSSQGRASFIIDVEVGENIEDAEKEFYLTSGTTITFQLDFLRSRNGYWYLDGTKLKNNFKINALRAKQNLNVSSGTATNQVDVGAVFNRNFACFQTDAAVFKVLDGKYSNIGIALRNFEVALELVGDKTRFGYRTSDCVGTFSAGSWMGIIISVVFISILLFGYLMLQSIQTMDRFDDLKQKQIIINFKE
uniref:V-type proton ATPase subunit S1/VOA1 transmembrane domain-containing protein n=1 Tax=Brugia malayi TaxID=6279 RepID=A0A7I4KPX4_BRUMA